MSTAQGGPIQPVKLLSAGDLRQNGGAYALRGGPALPVKLVASLPNQDIAGGPALPVYILPAGMLRQNGGSYATQGPVRAIPIASVVTGPNIRSVQGGPAIPVVVIA